MKTAVKNKEIIAVYTKKGALLDVEFTSSASFYYNGELIAGFKAAPKKAMLYLGFENSDDGMPASLAFCMAFAKNASQYLSIPWQGEIVC